MKKFILIIAAAGIAAAVLAGCTQTAGPTPTPGTGPSAQTVWTGSLANASYRTWDAAPGYETTQPAKGPHGKQVRVYIDPTISATLKTTGATEWAVGSKIVKDAWDGAGAIVQVEYMEKTDQGWYFASFGTDGSINKEGVKVAPCQPCHQSGSDDVKSFKLP